jgi:hypothetical protein
MGIVGIKWRCPICNTDVGGSMGELKYHIKQVHNNKPEQVQKQKQVEAKTVGLASAA